MGERGEEVIWTKATKSQQQFPGSVSISYIILEMRKGVKTA